MFYFDATTELLGFAAAILLAAVAAVSDWRTGRIPNWLTLPPLIIAPLVYGIAHGWMGALSSLLGLVLCGVVPLFLFRQGAIGGGDVKLVAAIGASAGLMIGIEVELVSFCVAGLYALGRIAWEGKLIRTLGNSAFLALNPLLPKKWRRKISPTLMSTVRMGGSFLVAAVLSLLAHHPEFYT